MGWARGRFWASTGEWSGGRKQTLGRWGLAEHMCGVSWVFATARRKDQHNWMWMTISELIHRFRVRIFRTSGRSIFHQWLQPTGVRYHMKVSLKLINTQVLIRVTLNIHFVRALCIVITVVILLPFSVVRGAMGGLG